MVRRTGARAVSVPTGIVQSHPSNGQGIAMLPNGGLSSSTSSRSVGGL